MKYEIGDCRNILKEYPDDSFDSCVTDPPYELDFMGKGWDRTGIAYDLDLWWELHRVLKPGAFLLSFGGTRTYHRMACAVEDAGFEIRDMIPWIYGSGFPKSLDISKSIDKMEGVEREVVGVGHCGFRRMGRTDEDVFSSGIPKEQSTVPITAPATPDAITWNGWGTALKPAIEPIVVARKPLSEKNVASNVLKWGTGGINVDGCRISYQTTDDKKSMIRPTTKGSPFSVEKGWNPNYLKETIQNPDYAQGRFPANLILECICEEIPDNGHTNPNCPCYLLDEQSGENVSSGGTGPTTSSIGGRGIYHGGDNRGFFNLGDKGGSSRFFYVAKASRRERYFFCSVCQKAYPGDQRDNHRKHMMHCEDCSCDFEPEFPDHRDKTYFEKTNFQDSTDYRQRFSNHIDHPTKSNLLFHVTQKPEQLIRYLIKLVTPKNGTVLDPFLGSGTTLVAAHKEGFESFGIEIGVEYEPLIKARTEALPRRLDEFA